MTLDRAATLGVILFGLLVYFVVMPVEIEKVDYGRVVPATFPAIAVWTLIAAAAVQAILPPRPVATDWRVAGRAALILVALVVSLGLIRRFGFEFVAPPTALAAMLFIGERRWQWLAAGAAAPLILWLLVERMLDRPLL